MGTASMGGDRLHEEGCPDEGISSDECPGAEKLKGTWREPQLELFEGSLDVESKA